MKFKDKYPLALPWQEQKDTIFRMKDIENQEPCAICGEGTDWVDMNFECAICSEECLTKLMDAFLSGTIKSLEDLENFHNDKT